MGLVIIGITVAEVWYQVEIYTNMALTTDINNKPSFGQEHQGVFDGPDGSDGTSYPLMENQTRPVAQGTFRIAYLACRGYDTLPFILATRCVVYYARHPGVRLPLLEVRNLETYTYNQTDTCVTLFAWLHLHWCRLPNA
jgi:hypothetical protein